MCGLNIAYVWGGEGAVMDTFYPQGMVDCQNREVCERWTWQEFDHLRLEGCLPHSRFPVNSRVGEGQV